MLGEHEVRILQKFLESCIFFLGCSQVAGKNMNFLLAMHFTKDMERTVSCFLKIKTRSIFLHLVPGAGVDGGDAGAN